MKLSYVAGAVPTKYEIGVGDIAYNVRDKLQYTKLIDDTIVLMTDNSLSLGFELQGGWNAAPGVLPPDGTEGGELYVITNPGTLTVVPPGATDDIPVPTACVNGDFIVYSLVNDVWYLLQPSDEVSDATYVNVDGDTMTGYLSVPGGATGTQVPNYAQVEAALQYKADLASPAFTGLPTAPTAPVGTNNTRIATTAFVLANSSSSGVTAVTASLPLISTGGNTPNISIPAATALIDGYMPASYIAQIDTNISDISQNTSDIALKANIASPAFTGVPTAPNPLEGDNSTQIATTAYANGRYIPTSEKGATEGVCPLNVQQKISPQYITFSGLEFMGGWDAAPGILPPDGIEGGEIYIITNAGTLSVIPPTASDVIPVATLCEAGQFIVYGLHNSVWYLLTASNAINDSRYVQLAGSTMTGHLNVPGGATGTQVPNYDQISSLTAGYLPLTGGVLSGVLTIANTYPSLLLKDTDFVGGRWYDINVSEDQFRIIDRNSDGSARNTPFSIADGTPQLRGNSYGWTIAGMLTLKHPGNCLDIGGSAPDQPSYMVGRAADGVTAGWFIGRGSATTQVLSLHNYIVDADITLDTQGTGTARLNGQPITTDDELSAGLGASPRGIALGTTQDPNINTDEYILTNHVNVPNPTYFWHIRTQFYNSATGNRSQIALSYSGPARAYIRNNYETTPGTPAWTPWAQMGTMTWDGTTLAITL